MWSLLSLTLSRTPKQAEVKIKTKKQNILAGKPIEWDQTHMGGCPADCWLVKGGEGKIREREGQKEDRSESIIMQTTKNVIVMIKK